jgi:hypothetical protein
MLNPANPNFGPLISLVGAFLSALMDLLTVFHLFGFTENQRTAVIAVTTGAIFLGLYLYAILHQQAVKLVAAYPQLRR